MMDKKVLLFKTSNTADSERCGACHRRMTKKRYLARVSNGNELVICEYCYQRASKGTEYMKAAAEKSADEMKKRLQDESLPDDVREAYESYLKKYGRI